MTTQIWAMVIIFFATIIGAVGSLFLKYGSEHFVLNLKKLFTNYKVIFGLFLYGIASIMFIIALRGGELTVLYPMTSLSYIWISFLSIKFLKEKMNKFKWLGIFAIIVGVTLIGLGS